MYNEQQDNYSTGGNYSSGYQGYNYGERRTYDYYETPRPKKKNRFGKVIAIFLAAAVVIGGSAVGGFYLGNNFFSKGVTETTVIEEVAPEPIKEVTLQQPQVSESGIESTQTVTAVVTDVTNVVEEVMPSVVSITNTSVITQSFWGQQFQSENQSSGSGIIVGENETELLIVTNNHVISDSTELKVQFIDGSIADAKVKGTDSNMDLAVIAVALDSLERATISNISIAVLGDSESLKVGEPAIAIGNALGYGQSVTTGVISALNRQIAMSEDGSTTGTLIQTDAAINPGNSGGALLNVRGEVVGINSNKIGGSTIEGMGYAIPISNAKPIIEELMNRETKDKVDAAKKGYLGISGLNVTTDVSTMYGMPEGVYVAQVYSGGAYDAGIMKGDIITAFDGSSVKTMEDLQGYLEYYEIGEKVLVTIQRPNAGGYVEQKLLVTLGAAQTQNP
ncbi:MAG: trypsin-like peptidase domain-containing protein [Lachnospiraceae bacterium]|nr:trypsin-like peptidase domain-containing protein [Lachnospiraceae bacterium]